MPSITALGDKAIEQLVEYLLSLKGKVAASASAGAVAAATSTGLQAGPGLAVTIIGSAEHGAIIFAGTCSSCHGPQGTGSVANPGSKGGTIPPLNPIDRDEFNPDPKAFAEKIDLYIQHGSRPEGPNPQVSMLPFGDSNALTQQQIADLEGYILTLNGVDRAKINHPGLSPGTFFIITVFAFALVGINLCGWWWFWGLGKRRKKEVGK
jgi:mono/diheme cytochrome c family protein